MTTLYDELRERFASHLDRAAQEPGNLPEIETDYEELDEVLPRGEGPEYDKLHIALNFWDGWIDARNHDWQYYEGISEQDWPHLARILAADLRANREPHDERIRHHCLSRFQRQFDYPNRYPKDHFFTGSLSMTGTHLFM